MKHSCLFTAVHLLKPGGIATQQPDMSVYRLAPSVLQTRETFASQTVNPGVNLISGSLQFPITLHVQASQHWMLHLPLA